MSVTRPTLRWNLAHREPLGGGGGGGEGVCGNMLVYVREIREEYHTASEAEAEAGLVEVCLVSAWACRRTSCSGRARVWRSARDADWRTVLES